MLHKPAVLCDKGGQVQLNHFLQGAARACCGCRHCVLYRCHQGGRGVCLELQLCVRVCVRVCACVYVCMCMC